MTKDKARHVARVALPLKGVPELTYEVPDALARRLQPGHRVVVPLKGKVRAGCVVAVGGEYEGELRSILDIADPDPAISPEIMRLCTWISDYYAAPIGEVLRGASAGGPGAAHARYGLSESVARSGDDIHSAICRTIERRALTAAAIVRRLGHAGVIGALLDLVDDGTVVVKDRPSRGAIVSATRDVAAVDSMPPLTSDQRVAVAGIVEAMGRFTPILLHGVTASGKTRVYIEAIQEARKRGRTALYLLPEIAMCLLLEDQLAGLIPFCTLHSMLSASEKARRFAEIRAGRVPLVIGTRSALFAPLRDLGVIIVDEEHDPSYKQEERVRYHARDAAVMRAKFQGIPIVMGSATPAIETYQLGLQGRYVTFTMKSRLADRPLPRARIVDMRSRRKELLSQEMKDEVLERLQRGEQVILLINRRGYAPFLICTGCGAVFRCGNCQVSMAYHKDIDAFLCHYCGAKQPQPQLCSVCQGGDFVLLGEGTEKVMESLQQVFAGYRVDRLDSDVSTSPNRVRKILQEFASGEIHVLVGTQILAKGHHFPRVTLVGIVTMDHLLGMPDFRAAERVFQLVAQVAGRSGRGDLPGEVIIQTRYPGHYALRAGCAQDYGEFFEREIGYRRTMKYPPFSSLVLLTFRDADKVRVARHGRAMSALLSKVRAKDTDIIGPVFAPIPRIKHRWGVNVLIRGEKKQVRDTLRRALLYARGNKLSLGDYVVDVDPLDLM